MSSSHVDTLLVVDDDNKLIGLIGRKALYWTEDKNTRAADMVYKDMPVARPDDNIVDILKLVDEEDINNMPVVDDEGRLKGLLTSSNLVSTLSRQFLSEEEAEKAEASEEAEAAVPSSEDVNGTEEEVADDE